VYVAIATGVAEILIVIALVLRLVITSGRKPQVSAARFRAFAEEQRRMTDQALTASQHVNVRIADLTARVDELRRQVDRILADAE
jgi:gamma-glutamyl:cysteine ligase YbdK (ATP-grasp superfamily)